MCGWLFLGMSLILGYAENDVNKGKINFDEAWKFHLGDVDEAQSVNFDDKKWRSVDLPHDWSIEPIASPVEGETVGPFSKKSQGKSDTGHFLGGQGWYRKTFTISKEDAGKNFVIYFEGIYNQAEVWINGQKAAFNAYGYSSFRVDLTKFCNAPGKANVLAVKVINEGKNSRWYTGSGIYRHVCLIKTDKIHLDTCDTFISTSKLKDKNAELNLITKIHNKINKDAKVKLGLKIFSPAGKEVYSMAKDLNAKAASETPFNTSFNLKNVEAWSTESPALYKMQLAITSSENSKDIIEITFGIRTIEANAKDGFLLNGKSIKLKGGCIHHDNGLLGAAAIDRAEERKVELLKANGYNAIRCSHNIPSEHFLDTCDRLGMLVIDEAFDQWTVGKTGEDYPASLKSGASET